MGCDPSGGGNKEPFTAPHGCLPETAGLAGYTGMSPSSSDPEDTVPHLSLRVSANQLAFLHALQLAIS